MSHRALVSRRKACKNEVKLLKRERKDACKEETSALRLAEAGFEVCRKEWAQMRGKGGLMLQLRGYSPVNPPPQLVNQVGCAITRLCQLPPAESGAGSLDYFKPFQARRGDARFRLGLMGFQTAARATPIRAPPPA